MEKLILMDGTELVIEEGASLDRIPVKVDGYASLEGLAGKLGDENLRVVKFTGDDITTGEYKDMTLAQPHFTVTMQDDGKLLTVFRLREKTREELQQGDVQVAISFLSDEQALTVPALYPEWKPNGTYEAGDRRQYEGGLYKCLQSHTGQADWSPDAAPSLWTLLLIPDPDAVLEWVQPDSTNGYSAGDKVTHNGKLWESLTNSNVWEPGATGTENLWQEAR